MKTSRPISDDDCGSGIVSEMDFGFPTEVANVSSGAMLREQPVKNGAWSAVGNGMVPHESFRVPRIQTATVGGTKTTGALA